MLTRALPVLLLLIVFGCAKNDVEEGATLGIVIPEVIDIGQVRAKDSPAHSSFTIVNHSTIPVEIDEILSGCGCTVIDLPQKIIRPNETVEVPVKINLFRRKGDFNTDLLVRSTSGESWHIRITGKVIEDLWYAGQSIRFHIDLEQEVVSKDFTISTVDYPNVQFECETDNSDIHLSELSRSTDDGETRILFRLTVHNAAGLRTSSLIDLIPINVDLPKLTIPVYFHHLLGEQKQYLATSQINLGGIKRDENTAVKVYGDRTFLHNVHKVQALSKDDVVTVVSYAVPTADADFLEIILKIAGDYLKDHELIRGSLALFSSDDNVATIQASGIVVSE